MRKFVRSLIRCALVSGAVLAVSMQLCRVDAAAPPDAHAMDAHMKMTAPRPVQPGDQARAEAIVAAARKVAEHYSDYQRALADGYMIFMPDQTQPVYHFVRMMDAEGAGPFDALKPPALLYEKTTGLTSGYKLVGVMYMAPYGASEQELDERAPLSVARWHEHLKMCAPADAGRRNWLMGDAQFGLDGAIATRAACDAAGGRFFPHLGGWMVHVYPLETDPAKVWGGEDDEHLSRGAMTGMKM